MAYLLLYVNDMVLSVSSDCLLLLLIAKLQSEFKVKDMGPLSFFLGVDVQRTQNGFFLSQAQYAEDLLQRAGMQNCKAINTPIDTNEKLSGDNGAKVDNPTEYRSMFGALQYLTITRPDIAHAVQQCCLHMHDPRTSHLALIKHILRHVCGTTYHGLHHSGSPSMAITAYSDWAGCPDTCRSTTGFCIFLGDSMVSWSSKCQATVSRSSPKDEYRAVAHTVVECCWLRQLLGEL